MAEERVDKEYDSADPYNTAFPSQQSTTGWINMDGGGTSGTELASNGSATNVFLFGGMTHEHASGGFAKAALYDPGLNNLYECRTRRGYEIPAALLRNWIDGASCWIGGGT